MCERFATSKIGNFDDLSNLGSFGFRGEALASISFVSDFKVITKQKHLDYGYQASFRDGKLASNPAPVPANDGTIMIVESLFAGLELRRKSINANEEKKMLHRLISSLAAHYHDVKFSLAIDGQTIFNTHSLASKAPEVRANIMQLITKLPAHSFILGSIGLPDFKVQIEGCLSKIGCTKTKKEAIIFINNRFVECDSVRRAIEVGYNMCYQAIHDDEGGFFAYISLSIDKRSIDCNVHPTKKSVKFCNEYEIAQEIQKWVFDSLKDNCQIKTFHASESRAQPEQFIISEGNSQNVQKSQVYDKNKVRVDPKLQKIDAFFQKLQEKKLYSQATQPLTFFST